MRTIAAVAARLAMPEDETDIRVELPRWEELPGGAAAFVLRVLAAARGAVPGEGALSVLLADDAAVRELNRTFRGIDKSTNVLAFPAAPGFGVGDVALAWETVAREAEAQGKTFAAHAAHLITHGYLHLRGFDHQADEAAEVMESAEREILAELGVADPYLTNET
ncbi:MAG: rRNA maturation RNase YbeY [Hyphomonadaceae bacterium]